jgi:hypothetical protein
MGLRLGLVRTAATFVYINVNDAAQPTAWSSSLQAHKLYQFRNCQISKHVLLNNSYVSFRR